MRLHTHVHTHAHIYMYAYIHTHTHAHSKYTYMHTRRTHKFCRLHLNPSFFPGWHSQKKHSFPWIPALPALILTLPLLSIFTCSYHRITLFPYPLASLLTSLNFSACYLITGKSTLIKLLVQETEPDEGTGGEVIQRNVYYHPNYVQYNAFHLVFLFTIPSLCLFFICHSIT